MSASDYEQTRHFCLYVDKNSVSDHSFEVKIVKVHMYALNN